jgi:hypothetical protein
MGVDGSVSVAKKKAQPRGSGRLVRIEPSIYTMAKGVAGARGIAIGDYLSEICRPIVSRDYLREMKRLEHEGAAGE